MGGHLVARRLLEGQLAGAAPGGDRHPRARGRGAAAALRYGGAGWDDDALPPDTPPEAQAGAAHQARSFALRAPRCGRGRCAPSLDRRDRAARRGALHRPSRTNSKALLTVTSTAALREPAWPVVTPVDTERVNKATLHTVDIRSFSSKSDDTTSWPSSPGAYQLQGPNTTLASHSLLRGRRRWSWAARSLRHRSRPNVADRWSVPASGGEARSSPCSNLDALGLLCECRRVNVVQTLRWPAGRLHRGQRRRSLVLEAAEPCTRAIGSGARRGIRGLCDIPDGGATRNASRVGGDGATALTAGRRRGGDNARRSWPSSRPRREAARRQGGPGSSSSALADLVCER